MRKIMVLSFVSLDGVMQAPGGPEEDPSGNFTHGGWTVPYFDEFLGSAMAEQMGQPFDLLLGRKTFEIFASYWPQHEEEGAEINRATKYVASNTLTSHEWEKSVFLSGNVADEFWLKIFPVTLGQGKRLFGNGAIPAAYTLVDSKTSPAGVILATFKRAGDLQTGSF